MKLLRSYHKANPGKSLKVDLQLVKQKMKPSENTDNSNGTTNGQPGSRPAINFRASVASVLGEEVTDKNALDNWLAQHNDNSDGFYVMGDLSGEGELR